MKLTKQYHNLYFLMFYYVIIDRGVLWWESGSTFDFFLYFVFICKTYILEWLRNPHGCIPKHPTISHCRSKESHFDVWKRFEVWWRRCSRMSLIPWRQLCMLGLVFFYLDLCATTWLLKQLDWNNWTQSLGWNMFWKLPSWIS